MNESERDCEKQGVSRRGVLMSGAVAGAGVALGGASMPTTAAPQSNPLTPVPIPPQASAKEGIAELAETRLWYWDTGGDGIPIVLAHPASGSGLIWGYQQPV